VVAQSRGAKLTLFPHAMVEPHVKGLESNHKLCPATNQDDSILNKALLDVSDEFDTTTGRYLEQLDFWGKDILNRNPRKENE